jgi:glycosyltransferase involved in cell wall biosynthesis
MSSAPVAAFYAPMKPPDHPVPSGDREMARLFLRLLEQVGLDPQLASTLRAFDPDGVGDFSAALASAAESERHRLLDLYRMRPRQERPVLWFTYHLYYKAPDLIGPKVARALAVPYVVAEGSRAPKQRLGAWRIGSAQAEAGLDAADLILVLNKRDLPALEAARPPAQRLVPFPPFIDASAWPVASDPARPAGKTGKLQLLAVAMMRAGDKLASYKILAEALAAAALPDWRLDIVGDGPARSEVEGHFACFGRRVTMHGVVDDRARLGSLYRMADLMVWPAVNEAFGVTFLEAALHGCPALAGSYGGVPGVVEDGRTGRLARPGDGADFAHHLQVLAGDEGLRLRLGTAARDFAITERSLEAAASALRGHLAPLLALGAPT